MIIVNMTMINKLNSPEFNSQLELDMLHKDDLARVQHIIDVVELALDWGMPVSEKDINDYNEALQRRSLLKCWEHVNKLGKSTSI